MSTASVFSASVSRWFSIVSYLVFSAWAIPALAIDKSEINVFYPAPNAVLQSSSTFLVGSAAPGSIITCNGEHVCTNKHGFFAHTVNLYPGVNSFVLKDKQNTVEKLFTVKRILGRKPISPEEFKLELGAPQQNLGLKVDDIIVFSVHATPHSKVIVRFANHALPLTNLAEMNLKQSQKSIVQRHRNKGTRSANLRSTDLWAIVSRSAVFQSTITEPNFAYGELTTNGETDPDLYVGFYRVTAQDHWHNLVANYHLTSGRHQSKLPSIGHISTLDQPFVARTTHADTIVRVAPSKARITPLDTGVRLLIDGFQGQEMRCLYGLNKHVWIAQEDLVYEGSTLPPQAIARAVNIRPTDYGTSVQIPLSQKLPYQVEQKLSPNSLIVRIYGVTADTDWITEAPPGNQDNPNKQKSLVNYVSWQQPDDYIYELTIHLTGSRQWGYKVKYQANTLCIGVKEAPKTTTISNTTLAPLSGIKVCLDPGHGSRETGAIGCSGRSESQINLNIALKLKSLLEASGATVTMTRVNENENPSLQERVKIANLSGADFLISIHNNALPDGRDPWHEHGTSSYWYHPQSLELAHVLKDELVNQLGFPDLGARYQNLALARAASMPAVLLELGFMINPDEYAKLIDDASQQRIASAIRQGLIRYLTKETGANE